MLMIDVSLLTAAFVAGAASGYGSCLTRRRPKVYRLTRASVARCTQCGWVWVHRPSNVQRIERSEGTRTVRSTVLHK